jgi:uncharacterized protein
VTALLLALLAFQIPAPVGEVNDFAGVLSAEDRAQLASRLAGTRVVVATFPSTDGEDPADLTNRVFKQWGVGKKDSNDGVLIAIYVNDHKWRIEVGYGAEAVLTDAQAATVGRETLVPYLRQGNYATGLYATATRVENILERKALAPRVQQRAPRWAPLLWRAGFLVLLLFLLSRRRRGGFMVFPWWWGGGGWGGGGGGGWGGGGGGDGGSFGGGSSGGGGAGGDW